MAQNYTIGQGKMYFAKYSSGEIPGAFRYLGNTPEFALTAESENLEHVSSEGGVPEVDDSANLSVTRTGTFVTDDIDQDNLALFFFGTASTVAITASNQTQNVTGPKKGDVIQLGVSDSDRVGHRNVTVASVGTLTENTDYVVDDDNGFVEFLKDATGTHTITYTVDSGSYERIISGSTPIQGQMRFIEDNPKGDNRTWVLPKVTLRPNGDIALKGTEWRQIPFAITVEKPSSGEAIYINGAPS